MKSAFLVEDLKELGADWIGAQLAELKSTIRTEIGARHRRIANERIAAALKDGVDGVNEAAVIRSRFRLEQRRAAVPEINLLISKAVERYHDSYYRYDLSTIENIEEFASLTRRELFALAWFYEDAERNTPKRLKAAKAAKARSDKRKARATAKELEDGGWSENIKSTAVVIDGHTWYQGTKYYAFDTPEPETLEQAMEHAAEYHGTEPQSVSAIEKSLAKKGYLE